MQAVGRHKTTKNTQTKKESKSLNKKSPKKNLINLMYMPAVVMFVIFVIYPFLDGVRISLTNWNGYSQEYSYIGFSNYKSLLKCDTSTKKYISLWCWKYYNTASNRTFLCSIFK